ncbi:glycosyltransferase [Clostridium tarantellae]|uniref:Glycosyltransferase n=1 Tax=Clostridium tarantellae TaxID=39493 RepID=A0A6I1MND9_9CLOT|nr:glycosyltransferase [Clostridium tarantellae]MPQ44480.1 glycosyltransferase [Clostridium tarantellae]
MNIGFVSVWQERGASYVTKAYLDIFLKYNNNVYVYCRGNTRYDVRWNQKYVTKGLMLNGTKINWKHFEKWIKKNNLNIIFFNEQRELAVVKKLKMRFENIKIGSYIDYYKENTVKDFIIFDFLICNTKRHFSVFSWHPQCYYVPWGTDISLFKPTDYEKSGKINFFHSAGLSNRKGTNILYKAFIEGGLYKKSNLIIHTQHPIEKSGISKEEAKKYNIKIIEKTITAPGLYSNYDVYVYPTMLDGLGLTIYEALACGLPVITSNEPPMNEIINNNIGKLVDIKIKRCRYDAYYWPIVECDEKSLIEKMNYYIDNIEFSNDFKNNARKYAIENLNWEDRQTSIYSIFIKCKRLNTVIENKNTILKLILYKIVYIIPDYFLDKFNRLYGWMKSK